MDNSYLMHEEFESNNDENSCSDFVVGMAYVLLQKWEGIMDIQESLGRGTLFEALDKPFFGEDVWKCKQ